MEYKFIDFWRLYAPVREFRNRYVACLRLWDAMDEQSHRLIMEELRKEQTERSPPVVHEKNPYFYLLDWEPAQPQWLSPKEVGYLMTQHVTLAVCYNAQTQRYGTVTKKDALQFGLKVHHWMNN